MADFETIPQGAIDHLLANPTTTEQFDNVFGSGRAAEVLAAQNPVPEPQAEGDDDWTVAGEALRAIGGGVRDAAHETANFAQWVDIKVNDAIFGEGKVLTFEGVIDREDSQFMFGDGGKIETPEVAPNKTLVGGFGRGITQFTTGFLAAGSVTRLTGLKGAFVNGALADAVVFDPKNPNITTLLEEYDIDMGVFGDVIATDPDDPEYINRLRNAAEGALAGGIVEAIGWSVRALRASKAGDEAAAAQYTDRQNEALRAVDEAIEEAGGTLRADLDETLDLSRKVFDDNGTAPSPWVRRPEEPTQLDIDEVRVDADATLDGQGRLDLGDTPREAPVRPDAEATTPRPIRLTPERVEQIRMQARLAAGASRAEKQSLLSFRSLSTVTDFEDVLDDIAGVRAVMADEFAQIKGGDVQRWATVKAQAAAKLREMAQMTGEDPEALIRRFMSADLGDTAKMAAEIHARSRYILTVEKELKEMAQAIATQSFDARRFPGIRDMDHLRLAFNQRREVAANLLAGQEALRSNVARAMNAMKIAVKGDENLQQMLRDPAMFRDVDAAARAVIDPKNADQSAIKTIDDTLSKLHGYMDRVNSFRINALLSGPGTQEVNLISNVVNSFVIPTEQAMGAIAKGDYRLMVHATRQLQGSFAGMLDSVKASLQAGWYDNAILDPFNGKIEDDALRTGITGISSVDKVIASPSRALMTMDEFFKQSAYRGRIFADASAEAAEKGLRGSDRADYIREALKEAYSDSGQALNGEALLQSRRTTFTEPLEPGVASMLQKAAIDYPLIRFVIPFVRTPINILSQTYQHFPALGTTSKRYRADIEAGGARAAQARGRQVVGTALVGMAGFMAASGYITGSGPTDPRIRRVWLKNNQPYSFRIPQEDGSVRWVSFARLEPLSNVFSIAADTVEIMNDEYNEGHNQQAGSTIRALTMAVMENSVNKTFTQGIYDAMSLFVGKPHERESALRNFVASFVPNVLNQTNGDDTLREARNVTDAIMARTHLYNQVDPRRNVLGEPIVRALPKYDPLGLTQSDTREVDTVLEEIARIAILNQTVGGNPARRIDGPNEIDLSKVPYSDTQSIYDRWLELIGTVEIGGRTLRQQLEDTMDSRSYQRTPDGFEGAASGTKAAIIRRIISSYRDKARSELPELVEIIQSERRGGALLLREQANGNRQSVVPLFPRAPEVPATSPRRRTFEDLLNESR